MLGVIGRNGAGKSTLLKILTRITAPTSGRVEIRGRVGSLLEVGTGFHPELTGRENVYLNGAILGMKRREIGRSFDEIVDFAGVSKFLDTPVKRYSSGMYVRLAFAVAAHLEPEILLVDEVLAVGDAEFQARCLGRMEELGDTGGPCSSSPTTCRPSRSSATARSCSTAAASSRDGPSEDVVARYLQTSAGAGSRRTWSADEAPGDDLVRMRSVRDRRHGRCDGRSRRRAAAGRGRARVRGARRRRTAGRAQDQGHDRGARSRSTRWTSTRAGATRRRRATTWRRPGSPATFSTRASSRLDAAVCSIDSPKLHHHVSVHEAVSFHVQDPAEGDSSRGTFTGQWRGVVRPLLEWTVERA